MQKQYMDYLHHVSIQCLRKHNVIYGDNPLMRWFTNNVAVKVKPDGNEVLKKDENRRKTDGFMAFVHALYRADDITKTCLKRLMH